MTIDSTSFTSPSDERKASRKRSSCLITLPSKNTAKITVNHWQLRDLVQPSSVKKNEILYTYDDTIRVTDRFTDKVSTVCTFDFHPRCFKELNNNIVAGGVYSSIHHNNSNTNLNRQNDPNSVWRGLLSFYNRDTSQSLSIRLGSYINNSVSINRTSNNQYNSYVCNNDTYIYKAIISPSSIIVDNSMSLGYPLNHSALSEDEKNLVVVGDCSNVFLLHPGENPSGHLRSDNIIETQCDSGFSTSFSTSGIQFATCFQDGTCLIYDVRNTSSPVQKILSTRKNTSNGAFRCVKYSKGTDDLLIISEHVGRVHVIDSRDFSNHQVIMLPVNNQPHLINDSSVSLNNLEETKLLKSLSTPKILDYNDILSYEGNLLNPDQTSRSTAARSLNNYNLLSSLATYGFDDYAYGEGSEYAYAIEDDDESEDGQSIEQLREGLNRDTGPGFGYSEFDYCDNEISGVDWYEDRHGSHIVIGCDNGLYNWDVDSLSRRSFPSFKLA